MSIMEADFYINLGNGIKSLKYRTSGAIYFISLINISPLSGLFAPEELNINK